MAFNHVHVLTIYAAKLYKLACVVLWDYLVAVANTSQLPWCDCVIPQI